MLAQFTPRLLLTGAVVTAMTASVGTVLTFPQAVPSSPVQPSANLAAPVPQALPALPPQANGAQIAELAAAPAAPAGPPARAQRSRPETPTQRSAGSGEGLSEADWARLPPGLRQQVRLACKQGFLTGAHCTHA